MKLKFLLLGIFTMLSCTSCFLLNPYVERDENGNEYTTKICAYDYRERGESDDSLACHEKSNLRKAFEWMITPRYLDVGL